MAYPLTDWNTGLFDCCEDTSTCCYGFCCCPCLACTVSGKFGENRCLPLCDMLTPAITAACGLPLCAPPAALALRVGIRHRYGIKMHRELKFRKKNNVVIVNKQPPPVHCSLLNSSNIRWQQNPRQTGAVVSVAMVSGAALVLPAQFSGRFGENRCLPLCDILSPAITASCGIPLFVPPAVLSLRAAVHHRYHIKV
ncbi:hypothetical protein F7725_027917 [Dissostichus mawsoni]|uniref:Uncharacterized protein n=1 Tax=Dissostichus mawsoni TaxID=36200 RepID=A0A7J5XFB0_DISMA|nr:hypothetical protein F7725_027917 [Dissostichus mawsoni]